MITINERLEDSVGERKDALGTRKNPFTWRDVIELGISTKEQQLKKERQSKK